ncbi:hypothetical protein ACFSUK_32080 [Sphingobium scionense]
MKLFRLAGYVGCALLVLPFPVSAKSQDTACQLPRTAVEPAARKQSVTPDDLLRLRDFGGLVLPSPLSLSSLRQMANYWHFKFVRPILLPTAIARRSFSFPRMHAENRS